MKLRDRIKCLKRVAAKDLLPNPKNWRTHPAAQQDALRGILAEVGIAGALLARETPNGLMLIDGHLRADTDPSVEWPVLVLDVDEAEADKLLATVDPIADMAGTDPEKLDALLREIDTGSEALQEMLAGLAETVESHGQVEFDDPPDTVVENVAEMERTIKQRRDANKNTAEERDTEHYLVIVYASRRSKELALKRLGLPQDERYISSSSVSIRPRGAIPCSGKKSADASKSGACG